MFLVLYILRCKLVFLQLALQFFVYNARCVVDMLSATLTPVTSADAIVFVGK